MIGLATLGTSEITRTFIAACRDSNRIHVAAVVSRDDERARGFAAELGVPTGYGGLDEALADPSIEAVYVATPNALHPQAVEACVRAGRHVVAEKPLAPTAAEAAALFALAAERNVVLLEGMRSAYDPGMAAVRTLLPTLGTPRRASFRYCQRSARYDRLLAGESVAIFDPAMAGGSLYDLGVYCIHPLIDLFGEPTAVAAADVPLSSGADGTGTLIAAYPGFVADLGYSKISSSLLPSEIQGERGTLTIDHIAQPRHLVVDYADGRHVELRPVGADNTLIYEVDRFCELVETVQARPRAAGEPPWAADAARSLAAARVLDLARADAAHRRG